MRRDNQLYEGVESDIINEANNSGCCVRRDQSGCVQVLSIDDCPVSIIIINVIIIIIVVIVIISLLLLISYILTLSLILP